MNNKGLTLIEMLGVMIILSIMFSLATFGYINYLNDSKDKAFKIAVNSFEDAALSALEDCETNSINSFCTKYIGIPDIGEKVEIELEDLINSSYIDTIKSPYNNSDICEGSIIVERVGENKQGRWDYSNIDLKYETCLKCGTHQTDKCK